jgi:hypothetical protein
MPRKSAILRLSQSKTLLDGYIAADIAETRGGRFIKDMVWRLEKGKGLSKGMRNWLDSLIEEGVPEPKGDPEVITRIESALKTFEGNINREWEAGVLRDFRHKFVMGWNLSEKQTALFEKLLQRADDDNSGANLFVPSEEQRSDLEALVKLYKGYNSMWRSTRPAVAKSVTLVEMYLAGEATIEEYHYNKLFKSMGSRLKKFRSPRFKSGDIGWITLYDGQIRGVYNSTKTRSVCTAITDAYITLAGVVVNEWLLPTGAVVEVPGEMISKRRG